MAGDAKHRKTSSPNEEVSSNFNFTCSISELPMLILLEIFFRIPITSIALCNCVCKAWHNLISDPNFPQLYTRNSNFKPLLYVGLNPRALQLIEISVNGDCSAIRIVPNLPNWLDKRMIYQFLGSCNGILCFLQYKPWHEIIHVCNPVTGMIYSVSVPDREGTSNTCSRLVKYLFGFSPCEDKYKLVRISYGGSLCDEIQDSEIFTVGVDERWRSLPVSRFRYLDFHHGEAISCGGVFHWIPRVAGPKLMISTFNLADEKSGQISVPPELVSEHVEVGGFEDQLSLVHFSESQISLWVMKRYRVVDSWTKVLILRSWFPPEMSLCNVKPVAELQNGEMLLLDADKKTLMSCNIKEKKCKIFRIFVERMPCSIEAYAPNFFLRANTL